MGAGSREWGKIIKGQKEILEDNGYAHCLDSGDLYVGV